MLWDILADTCFSSSSPARTPCTEHPGNALAYTYFCFSFPVSAPLVWRAMGHLSLCYLQLSCQGTLCTESPRITAGHAHCSFSCPCRAPSAWRSLEALLPMPTLATAVLSGCHSCTQLPRMPLPTPCVCLSYFDRQPLAESLEHWFTPTLFSALLSGHPL